MHTTRKIPAHLGRLLLALGAATFGARAAAADLTVEVNGVTSAGGEVAVALFNNADEFPAKFAHGKRVKAEGKTAVVVFKDLPPGRYAVSAYHDANENKKLDRGLFGIPKEPYGFSQEARGFGGPPEFRDAAFELPADGARVSVRVK
ncbi:MAG TPA: DUF2141 domain-containing protein [Burkholderiaceae bacterium]|nr:DUF2141 domain-containing protein [Burkholderiaceae bacterium]